LVRGKRPQSPARDGARPRRRPATPPTEFDQDPLVWAAWLYYEEGLTQEAVARLLATSRASVIALLQDARTRNIVSISVSPRHLQSVSLSRELAAFGDLAGCIVIPDGSDRMAAHERVGQAGARLLTEMLRNDRVLGVSWGLTVLALSNALPKLDLPRLTVVQVTGSFVGTYEMSAELCTSNIASRTGGRCVYLHAPGLVSQPRARDILMREPTLVEEFRILRTADLLVFGVGGVGPASTAFVSGYMPHGEAAAYVARGAVGVVAGRFIDRDGRAVIDRLDRRMIGLEVAELAAIPTRVCVACGRDKVAALRAVLRGRLATHLVTDARTARRILAGPPDG